jgi:N-acyl-D-aspartate/D-glutamate deacylase
MVDGIGTARFRIDVGERDRVIVAVVFSRPLPARNG